jgi:hypothetical protein
VEDNSAEKRARQIARTLAVAVTMIRTILVNLDDIRLSLHAADDDMRERIAEDYLMVARDVLASVKAPVELLSIIRSALVDWIVLSDLVSLSRARGANPRQLETMEEMAERLATTMEVIRDLHPELFEDTE